MSKGRLLLANIIGIIVVLGFIAGGGYIYYQNENYVSTEDATVSADMMQIVAPSSGILKDWNGEEGANVSENGVVGAVSDGEKALSVHAGENGTIIKNEAKKNQMVQAGQVLGEIADMDHLYVTANINETDLNDIEVGDSVDIKVDGDKEVTFDGKIEGIGYATNSVFSALPSQNASGNYTKVTQKVPVKISIQNPSKKVLPGMNAKVKISL
ncbi:HlyD family efflux transporter periplasmic adaptor subunit [Metabacillus fastidiosus]|uniref:HlyD family efflux transporter periplasmic adaptor subunit n=1 Tax=Metabacillus fastidiosus TaxID=1458 RepID=UPI002E1B3C85|nr:HlyD family efflux transporter periplasmic adaptor subunit [Metabacillus fastidiosus]